MWAVCVYVLGLPECGIIVVEVWGSHVSLGLGHWERFCEASAVYFVVAHK
jgi:hypothetical protein